MAEPDNRSAASEAVHQTAPVLNYATPPTASQQRRQAIWCAVIVAPTVVLACLVTAAIMDGDTIFGDYLLPIAVAGCASAGTSVAGVLILPKWDDRWYVVFALIVSSGVAAFVTACVVVAVVPALVMWLVGIVEHFFFTGP